MHEAHVREWVEANASGAFLTHFDPGSGTLQPPHEGWLRAFARRFSSITGDLYVVGLTSRSGEEVYDRALAERRARAVYRFLRRTVRSSPRVHVHLGAKGSGLEGSPAEAPAHAGAVAVVHVKPGRVPPWLEGELQQRPLPTDIFYVRLAWLREAGPAYHLEIADGRWSILYGAVPWPAIGAVEGTDVGQTRLRPPADPAEPPDLGPWHTFVSPFELVVDQFGGSRARLTESIFGPEGFRLQLSRPAVALDPFVAGSPAAAAVLRGLLAGEGSGGGPHGAPLQVLESRGRSAVERPIPAPIRAHLRRGGRPGARSRQ